MSRRQVAQAVELYESFREKRPRKLKRLNVSVPRVVACMGHVEGIDYRTTHGKKVTLYHHDFAPGSRPLLCVSADGRQLLLLGGRYEWDGRGIVDKAKDGSDIIPDDHHRHPNPKRRKIATVRDPEHAAILRQAAAHFAKDEAKQNPGPMTLAEAKARVRALGFTLVKRDGEYIVKPAGGRIDDPASYFTNDIIDAVQTARAMAIRAMPAFLKPQANPA